MKIEGKMVYGAGVRKSPQNQKNRPIVRSPKTGNKFN